MSDSQSEVVEQYNETQVERFLAQHPGWNIERGMLRAAIAEVKRLRAELLDTQARELAARADADDLRAKAEALEAEIPAAVNTSTASNSSAAETADPIDAMNLSPEVAACLKSIRDDIRAAHVEAITNLSSENERLRAELAREREMSNAIADRLHESETERKQLIATFGGLPKSPFAQEDDKKPLLVALREVHAEREAREEAIFGASCPECGQQRYNPAGDCRSVFHCSGCVHRNPGSVEAREDCPVHGWLCGKSIDDLMRTVSLSAEEAKDLAREGGEAARAFEQRTASMKADAAVPDEHCEHCGPSTTAESIRLMKEGCSFCHKQDARRYFEGRNCIICGECVALFSDLGDRNGGHRDVKPENFGPDDEGYPFVQIGARVLSVFEKRAVCEALTDFERSLRTRPGEFFETLGTEWVYAMRLQSERLSSIWSDGQKVIEAGQRTGSENENT